MNISIENTHKCGDRCKKVSEWNKISEMNGVIGYDIQQIENPNYNNITGECLDSGKKQEMMISFEKYPKLRSNIVDMDEIVIEDQEIDIQFDFLLKLLSKQLSPQPEGFTRGNILDIIYKFYEGVYNEEGIVEDDFYFQYKRKKLTDLNDISNIIHEGDLYHSSSHYTCEKCEQNFENNEDFKRFCGSDFHQECLDEFMSEHSIYLEQSDEENDIIEIDHLGKILPIKERMLLSGEMCSNIVLDRYLESLTYYPEKKLLEMYVGS